MIFSTKYEILHEKFVFGKSFFKRSLVRRHTNDAIPCFQALEKGLKFFSCMSQIIARIDDIESVVFVYVYGIYLNERRQKVN